MTGWPTEIHENSHEFNKSPFNQSFPETKDALAKCMKSMMEKSGKMRQLLRDLQVNYASDTSAQEPL